MLIQNAFNVPEMRIEGGPSRIKTKKFDLEAKSDPALDEKSRKLPSEQAREQKRRMLEALLADRFALKVHEETRMLPIYALVVSKGGPKFQPSEKDGTTISSNGNNGNVKMTVQGSDHTLRLLAEQLEPDKGPVTILVVDQLGPPPEN